MSTKLSATVMETRDGEEIAVEYYVRAVGIGGRSFLPKPGVKHDANERDGWAAYREEPVIVSLPTKACPGGERTYLWHTERVSDSPRATIEEAAADMYAAIRLHTDPDRRRNPARLASGELPEG